LPAFIAEKITKYVRWHHQRIRYEVINVDERKPSDFFPDYYIRTIMPMTPPITMNWY
jgi:hypothetical protein